MTHKRQKQEETISARIPSKMKELVQKYLERDTHLNESDLVRDAIREKIKRDAPSLFEKVFQTDVAANGN